MDLAELEKFPYPFKDDVYRYSNNSILMDHPSSVEITSRYKREVLLKRDLLSRCPNRCFQSRPHTKRGQWEITELIIHHLVNDYPEQFTLHKNGPAWTFRNHILDEEHNFIVGDEATIPYEPLDFIGRHIQEDVIFMAQRDGDLFLDAGQLCFPANWSLAFNLGMRFKEIHSPIPGFKQEGLDDRILKFLLSLEAGSPCERKNWSLMAGDILDTSLETFDVWGKHRKLVTRGNAGQFVHLRVEVQKLFRLPRSNGILFTIHTHLLSLGELSKRREWLEQFYSILTELPPHILEYKGISHYKTEVIDYLKEKINGREAL